jgi:hypothetical protein
MSDEGATQEATSTDSQPDTAERLLAVTGEIRKKRGRPVGSKNRPKDGSEAPRVNEGNQKRIFAGALIALFAILGVLAGWFGYEYYDKLELEEAEEGGTYLLPIAQKIGWIAAVCFYLSFPAWLITKASQKFRRKVDADTKQPAPSPIAAQSVSPNPSNGAVAGDSGFIPSQSESARVEGSF